MKVKNSIIVAVLALIICLGTGCAKLGNGPVMTWSYAVYTTADSAYSPASNTEILAYGANQQILLLYVGSKMNPGSYSVHDNTSGPYVYYYSSGSFLYSQSGSINVASNNNNKMSGNFNVTFTDGSGMTGNFSNIPIR